LHDGKEHITIEPIKTDISINENDIQNLFLQRLNDYKLREIIREETKDINTILYLKAFADCDQLIEEDEE
jgi:His-Xaa-Ser system protein HxsD